ncbi:hypothetical protein RchiOBHm_Chr2g0112161 [Rosa chinensis]|uniref:Uncharacterized protein n=1 Tax=Rosa chinensis TaxID=74649 RepID=A0A2P6RQ49_ROSCH|nr:hypothetical protein RchiOBHm_Chr2g0112161 [Rosa chinensis]
MLVLLSNCSCNLKPPLFINCCSSNCSLLSSLPQIIEPILLFLPQITNSENTQLLDYANTVLVSRSTKIGIEERTTYVLRWLTTMQVWC